MSATLKPGDVVTCRAGRRWRVDALVPMDAAPDLAIERARTLAALEKAADHLGVGDSARAELFMVPDAGRAADALRTAVNAEAFIRSRLADDECEHGRLRTDSTPACGCWPGESATPDPFEAAAAAVRQGGRRRP